MRTALIILITVFVGSYTLGVLLNQKDPRDAVVYHSVCNVLQGECSVSDNHVEYKIMLNGVPSPLTPFNVQLVTMELQPDEVLIEFDMEGMEMGKNFYSLNNNNNGEYWNADVLLPVCSLGRHDWKMHVKIITKENLHITEFRFTQPTAK